MTLVEIVGPPGRIVIDQDTIGEYVKDPDPVNNTEARAIVAAGKFAKLAEYEAAILINE